MNYLEIGGEKREGWQTLDINPLRKPDHCGDVRALPQSVREIQWDVIAWIHGPASLDTWDLLVALYGLHMVMAPDGVLVLETPDADFIAKAWAGDPEKMRWVFGDPSHKDSAFMNRWAYTPATLSSLLREAGFTRIEVKPALHHYPARDFRIEARP